MGNRAVIVVSIRHNQFIGNVAFLASSEERRQPGDEAMPDPVATMPS